MLTKRKVFTLTLAAVMLISVSLLHPLQAAADTAEKDNGVMITSGDYISHAKAGILYEATTDTVIYAKNADMKLPPASMTKVMTAILVLEENPELKGQLTVDERAVSSLYCGYMVPQKHLEEGEVYPIRTVCGIFWFLPVTRPLQLLLLKLPEIWASFWI